MATATETQPSDPVAEELRLLRCEVHRLAGIVQSRLAPPIEVLTTREAAARAKVSTKTILKWVSTGILSDHRAGQGSRAEHRIPADEIDILLVDGVDAARRYRQSLGRE